MKKALLFVVLVAVAVSASAYIDSWSRREWESWSEHERIAFTAGMMHKEENMRLVAKAIPEDRRIFEWIDSFSIQSLTVREVVDRISAWYRLYPEEGEIPIALVYELVAIEERWGQSWEDLQ